MAKSVRRPHPWHPALVHFPIACWCLAVLVDALVRLALFPDIGGIEPGVLSHLLLWTGTATAVPAMVAGFIDSLRLPPPVRDGSVVKRHMLWMGSAWTAFLLAGVLRFQAESFATAPAWPVVITEIAGVACLIVGGRYAGRLVFQELVDPS